jgi:hypothetical protein
MYKSTLLFCTLLFFLLAVSAQDKLVINDRSGILSTELEGVISQKLREEGLSYTSVVDFTKRCEYFFSVLQKSGEDLLLRISDCNETLLGEKNLGSRMMTAMLSEQGILVSYAILDIISEPGKYMLPAVTEAPVPAAPVEAAPSASVPAPRRDSAFADEHNTRYFFAPSAYNLKKGESYYNTIYFLVHDLQYGVNDYFSIGMGTTVIGLPLYFTPKLSFPVGKKSAVGVGDLLMLGTWGTNFLGNLAYGTFSNGGRNGNFTIGAGYLYTNENDLTGQTSSLVSNFSAMTRLTPYIFLLTENYVMSANFNKTAWYNSNTEPWEYIEEEFVQRNTFWYGIMGIRIVTRARDYISWSMGLTYVVNFPGSIPAKYDSWEHDAPTSASMIAFPTVGFTVKFGNR